MTATDDALTEVSEAQADQLEQTWERERTYATLAEALAANGPKITDPQRWMIEDDQAADWALERLAEQKAEIARIDFDADAKIAQVKQWAEDAKKRPERFASLLEAKLIDYRRCLEAVNDRLPKTYKLPGGDIKVTAGRPSVKVRDTTAFVMWALDNRPSALSYKPLVSDLTDLPDEAGVLVDAETGEPVPGVERVTADPTYSVKVNTTVDPF